MSCPWSLWLQSPASFCEAPLCAWIREPGNTWSNAGFLLVAAIFYRETARPELRHLRAIAHITLLTGVGSMAFHATDTWLGAALDYAGMFLGGAFMLLICFFRWTRASRRAGLVFFWVLALAGGASFVLAPEAARWAYALEGIVCGLSEVTLFFTAARAANYRWFAASYAGFVPAMVLWTLDVNGTLCNPDNHFFSGHAAWHLLNAAAFYCTYRYFTQFEAPRVLASA